jgi:hypothetical protein
VAKACFESYPDSQEWLPYAVAQALLPVPKVCFESYPDSQEWLSYGAHITNPINLSSEWAMILPPNIVAKTHPA